MSNGSAELRAGILHTCQCKRRDGLQDFCPLTECGGPDCRADPVPLCGPANNGDSSRYKAAGPTATSTPPKLSAARRLPFKTNRSDHYVKMGKEGYIENPPLPPRKFQPCLVHRQRYF